MRKSQEVAYEDPVLFAGNLFPAGAGESEVAGDEDGDRAEEEPGDEHQRAVHLVPRAALALPPGPIAT